MIRRIALTLCAGVAVLTGAANSSARPASSHSASAGTSTIQISAKVSRSGYIVASS
jgi:hypothetical protein